MTQSTVDAFMQKDLYELIGVEPTATVPEVMFMPIC